MRRRRRVNHQRLRVSYIREVTRQLELVADLTSGCSVTFDTEGEDTTEGVSAEETFGGFVRGVRGETWVLDP